MWLKTICEPLWTSFKKPSLLSGLSQHHSFLVLSLLTLSLILAHSYQLCADVFNLTPWQSAMGVHTLITAFMLLLTPRSSLYILFGSCVWFGAIVALGYSLNIPVSHLLMFTWIPFVEEWVFRKGVGSFINARLGYGWLSLYYSALFFSFAHSWPTLDRWMAFDVGLVPGALCLGLTTGWVYHKTHSIMWTIVLHSLSNIGAWWFTYVEPLSL